jgi:2-keto-4-pentenoate hydratase/2-oxohepta-3-ene-1,7-dioic acid hydratase in catechol pathway
LLSQDSIPYLDQLDLELKVNGETRQRDNTENLVFKPAETLTELSSFTDLDVGDLVLTGTPSGCALQIPSPTVVKLFSLLPESVRWKLFKRIQGKREQYLQPDDKIEARIHSRDQKIHLGCQHNQIVEA